MWAELPKNSEKIKLKYNIQVYKCSGKLAFWYPVEHGYTMLYFQML